MVFYETAVSWTALSFTERKWFLTPLSKRQNVPLLQLSVDTTAYLVHSRVIRASIKANHSWQTVDSIAPADNRSLLRAAFLIELELFASADCKPKAKVSEVSVGCLPPASVLSGCQIIELTIPCLNHERLRGVERHLIRMVVD